MIQSLGRLQIAIGVDRYPKVLPMWYITGAYNEWEYRWLVSNVPSDLFFAVSFPLTVRKHLCITRQAGPHEARMQWYARYNILICHRVSNYDGKALPNSNFAVLTLSIDLH